MKKQLLLILFPFLLTGPATAIANKNEAGLFFSGNNSVSLHPLNPWDDGQVAWKNAFINQYSKNGNQTALYSDKLFGQQFDIGFLHKKNHSEDFGDSFPGQEYYEIGSRIKGDWGDITLSFENNRIGIEQAYTPYSHPDSPDQPFPLATREFASRTNGSGRLQLSERFSLEIELEYLSGESVLGDGSGLNLPTLAYSADLNSKFGNLNTRTIYFHMDRNHDFSRYGDFSLYRDNERGFRPLYILTGTQADIFTEDSSENSFTAQTRSAGIDGIAFVADYKASPRLKLHTAIGAASADKTPLDKSNYFGWEANIGLGYKILDNLTYELHLGYMATGDFFKQDDVDIETEDITIITQHLTLKF